MSDSDESSELFYEERVVTVGSIDNTLVSFRISSLGNEALSLEMLMKLEANKQEISGQRLWEGSILLCKHLIEHHAESLAGKKVLELGAGCGIVGLLCAKLGAAEVIISDGDSKCVSLIDQNILANHFESVAKSQLLNWNDEDHLSKLDSNFDFVVAGDVLYKHQLVEPLLKTTRLALGWGENGTQENAGGRVEGTFLLCHIPRAGVTHALIEYLMSLEGHFTVGFGDTKGISGVEVCSKDASQAAVYTLCKR